MQSYGGDTHAHTTCDKGKRDGAMGVHGGDVHATRGMCVYGKGKKCGAMCAHGGDTTDMQKKRRAGVRACKGGGEGHGSAKRCKNFNVGT